MEEALKNTKEALGLYLFGMEQDGETIPAARSIKDITLNQNCLPAVIEVFMPSVRAVSGVLRAAFEPAGRGSERPRSGLERGEGFPLLYFVL